MGSCSPMPVTMRAHLHIAHVHGYFPRMYVTRPLWRCGIAHAFGRSLALVRLAILMFATVGAADRGATTKGYPNSHPKLAEVAPLKTQSPVQVRKQRSLFLQRVSFAASAPVQGALWFCLCSSAWILGVFKRPRAVERGAAAQTVPTGSTMQLLDAAAAAATAHWREIVRMDTGHRCYVHLRCDCLGVVGRDAEPSRKPTAIRPTGDFALFR